ncbi:MAG TPA: hypothetical protein VEW48_06065 [Thermoanaerobaculia bacterium]|nr:hypothetical protein [Thermoanaerobaculia bacterium]
MSRSVPPPALAPLWRRSLVSVVAGLCLALVLGGLVVPHSAAEEHSDLPIGTHLDANARHPGAPLHMETADPEVVQPCPACLLQTGRQSILSHPVAVALPLLTGNPVAPEAERSADAPVLRLAPARAPPTVLSCR